MSSDLETIRLSERARPPEPGPLRLLVLRDGVFSSHALPASGDLCVGRAEDADISIDDRSISRRHAVLHLGPQLSVEDLGSANGTRVRERQLAAKENAALQPGDVLELGSTVLIVQRAATASQTGWSLTTHWSFAQRLKEECARAEGAGPTFAVIRFQVEGPAGAAEIQEALAPSIRPGDVVASYGPREYELLAFNISPGDAEGLMRLLAAKLEGRSAKVRSGVACYPSDGRAPEPLLAASSPASGLGEVGRVVRDEAMKQLHKLVDRIAGSMINVLLLGETGVGKEVLAGEIHRKSRRGGGPLLRLNCAALSETLLESELFGHEKGSFTGAIRSKPGLLETASRGTVLLDEVGELPLAIQAKLLRVLEERQVLRVGSLKPEPIDVRFVFATNRDLEAEVARGAFRQDFYYRLNGISLVIPPLRERCSEIAPLARDFAADSARRDGRPCPKLAPEALAELERYSWPGNIRELRNVIERAVLLASEGRIEPSHLQIGSRRPLSAPLSAPPAEATSPASSDEAASSLRDASEAAERRAIQEAMEKCHGNQTKAARLLGISRRTLVSRLQAYGLPRPRKGKSPEP